MSGQILPFQLQLLLILGCLVTYFFIIHKVKKANVRIDDMILWILGAITLLFLGVFPWIPAQLAYYLGFMSASNFIFCCLIFFLLLMLFSLSIKVSQQQEKIKELTHKIAMMEKNYEENSKRINN
ncbi:DUF2304 domain-containing protein [Turicibacter sanguinis]|uniref:DUF2304 domain-containing protein n=1 Tax=Turicibacter sanguinis TaxID=154288 RepID=UPI0029432507|nr:DUF2304 domain-containing protein [Turicibacter sanguinis]